MHTREVFDKNPRLEVFKNILVRGLRNTSRSEGLESDAPVGGFGKSTSIRGFKRHFDGAKVFEIGSSKGEF